MDFRSTLLSVFMTKLVSQGSRSYPYDINFPLHHRRSHPPPPTPAVQPETHPRSQPTIVWSLDAGFDRGIQPDEVQRDIADQGEVVGDVAGACGCVVIAKLNIQAPVQPVFDFPMTAYGAHELLGVGGQAADVVAELNARPVTDTACALDEGEALQVAPLIALVKPVARVESPAAAPFFPAVSRVVALPARGSLQRPGASLS